MKRTNEGLFYEEKIAETASWIHGMVVVATAYGDWKSGYITDDELRLIHRRFCEREKIYKAIERGEMPAPVVENYCPFH